MISRAPRGRLRRQWLLTALLFGGGILLTFIDIVIRGWIAFRDIALQGNSTVAVVAVGISPDLICVVITVARFLLGIGTGGEALWRAIAGRRKR